MRPDLRIYRDETVRISQLYGQLAFQRDNERINGNVNVTYAGFRANLVASIILAARGSDVYGKTGSFSTRLLYNSICLLVSEHGTFLSRAKKGIVAIDWSYRISTLGRTDESNLFDTTSGLKVPTMIFPLID